MAIELGDYFHGNGAPFMAQLPLGLASMIVEQQTRGTVAELNTLWEFILNESGVCSFMHNTGKGWGT